MENKFDLIISGAGPAGLSAAIFAGRKGLKVAVVEKGSHAGPFPRGETLRYNTILDRLLGEGFIDSISKYRSALREYFSPDPISKEIITKKRERASYIFGWDDLINGLMSQTANLNIDFFYNTTTIGIINKNEKVTGIKCLYNHEEIELFADTVMACDGHTSSLRSEFFPEFGAKDFPFVKCKMRNGNYDNEGFKFFFVPVGAFKSVSDFPPAIIFLFPHGETEFETGLMVLTDNGKRLGCTEPDSQTIMKVWSEAKATYPVFKDLVAGAKTVFEGIARMPMKGPVADPVPVDGLIFSGDTAGFVEASGGCGIISSFLMSEFWINEILKQKEKTETINSIWTDNFKDNLLQKYRKFDEVKHLHKTALKGDVQRKLIFEIFKTEKRIKRYWWLIKLLA